VEYFSEFQNFGMNLLTISFFTTLVFATLTSVALIKQMGRIKKRESGKSVSFIFYSYFGWSALAAVIYALDKRSLALAVNGLFVGIFALGVVRYLLKYKDISVREKVIGLIISPIIIPLVFFIKEKDTIFVIAGTIVLSSLFHQVYEVWHNKDPGSIHPAQSIISITASLFWIVYVFLFNYYYSKLLWPLLVFNPVALILWIIFLVLYFKYKRKEH